MLKGKKGIVFGIANYHSIAWWITKKLSENGAKLVISYQNNTLLKRVEPLSKKVNCELLIECDFSNENHIDQCFKKISQKWDSIDFIVHAAAYSDKNELNGRYLETSKDNFINCWKIANFV